jgi:serine/threonine protein kinase/Tol biopolymer transport system component
MSLAAGTRLGSYEVVAAIGSGGMGEVYRAHDIHLGRDVAIKVLPDAFVHDPERLARFEREARTLATLNHPNIAAVYGFEKSAATPAIVLELVEGPTLADRLAQGAMSLDEALPIARQIAEALEAAHEQGIIHRDLKPANVKVRADGTVKVLDFGLAKLVGPAESGSHVPHGPAKAGHSVQDASPTVTSPALMTGVGVLLGTAAYMSPEQARGRKVDKRGDIWAFGLVLYEMLTGKRAFDGQGVAETLARVIEREPDFKLLPPRTPPSIVHLLRRALVKDVRMRLPDIGVARLDILEAMTEPESVSRNTVQRQWGRAVPWIVVGLLAGTLVLIQLRAGPVEPARGQVTRVELDLPAGVELYTINTPSAVLSPDGTQVAFIGNLGGRRTLYLRRLDGFESMPLAGTETVQMCFFSADGRAIGFITGDRALKKVSLADGLVVTLARNADYSAGGTWSRDDRVTFSRDSTLWQVPASGGQATQLTRLDKAKGEVLHAFPVFVANGRTMLFTSVTGSGREASHIEALSVVDGQRRVIVDSGSFPLLAASGHLVFFRNNALLAAPFDDDRLTVGSAVRVVENLTVDVSTGNPLAAVSSSGALLYPPSGSGTSRLVWVSRQGNVEQLITDTPRRYQFPRLAPDGERISIFADGGVWIQDNLRSTFTMLTSVGAIGYTNSFAVWTPDGKRVLTRSRTGLRWIDTDGSARVQAVAGSTSISDIPSSVSPDGRTVAFVRQAETSSGDIYVVEVRGDSSPRPVLSTPAYEGGPRFSPDGRWMAYASDEGGQMQVYLRPFPGPDRREPVSTQGGTQPVWNSNGKELFYRNGDKMMVVDVSTNPDVRLSPPRQLFEQRYGFLTITNANYDVSRDGQRFLMVKEESGSGRLNLVLNWTEELKQKVPVP